MTRSLSMLTLLGGLAIAARAAGAQPAPAPAAPPTPADNTVALVINGGASLGAYEAGYLYVLNLALRSANKRISVVTGASAGSGNALFSALSACQPINDRPSADLGWNMWLDVGIDDLFRPAEVTPVSAFSTKPVLEKLELVRAIWRRGLPASCDVTLGLTVTRLYPNTVRISQQLTAPRQLMRALVRIRGRGPGKPPQLTNVSRALDDGGLQLLLPFEPDGDQPAALRNLGRLSTVMVASGTFPFAFPPVQLSYCVGLPGKPALPCTRPSHSALFVDGGVFDNVPLRLAMALAPSSTTPIIYLDPAIRAYREPPAVAKGMPGSALSFVGTLVGGFYNHARNAELFAAKGAGIQTGASSRLRVTLNRYPQSSNSLQNFFGLFEREFRRFDFYLGMYDAWRDTARWSWLRAGSIAARLSAAEWQPLACLAHTFDRPGNALAAACRAPGMRDLVVLMQIALDRVYEDCRTAPPDTADPLPHAHCQRAVAGNRPPYLLGGDARRHTTHQRKRPGESKEAYNLRLLAVYGFHFKDLGLTRAQARRAPAAVAAKLRRIIRAFTAKQPSALQSTLLNLGAAQWLQTVDRTPRWHNYYATVGTAVEVAGLWRLPRLPDALRLNTALTFDGLVSLLTQDENELAITAAVGPELKVATALASRLLISAGARIGYQFGLADKFGAKTCTATNANGDGRTCSQLVLHGLLGVQVAGVVRGQLTFAFYPSRPDFDDRVYTLQLQAGIQF